jgi:hypothetical protein
MGVPCLRANHTTNRRAKEKYVVCRTKVPYRLTDGTWVVNLSDLLMKINL